MADTVHPVEDAFHKLQTPLPPTLAVSADEVADAMQIALWNLGFKHHEVTATVDDIRLVLTGAVPEDGLRLAALDAAAKLSAGREVIDEIGVSGAPAVAPVPADASALGAPMLAAIRYCGLDAASMMAAIRSASAALAQHLSAKKFRRSGAPLIIYSNVRPETVTLGVGFIVTARAAGSADGEVQAARSPTASRLSEPLSGGPHGLVEAFERLRAEAIRQGLGEPRFYWHRPVDPDDPWAADPANIVHAGWA